ncbi:MAG: type I restriction enzyme endonuclease domain-containing protein [Pseudonocardiaceae bacterium]
MTQHNTLSWPSTMPCVDWPSCEPVRAKLRTRIRRLLATFEYPPEEERAAVDLVIKQIETFANEWAPEAPR